MVGDMGDRIENLVTDETKRQFVGAALAGGATLMLGAFEEVPWTLRIPMGLLVIAAALWLQDRYRVQINRFVSALGYATRPETFSAQLAPSSTVSNVHWSDGDRDNIADAFHELRTIINGDVSVLHGEAERIIHTWPQRPRKAPDVLDFNDTLQRLDRVRSLAGGLENEIFNVWLKKNKSYEAVLKPIINYQRPNCFSNLMHFCDRAKLPIESAQSACAKAPSQAHQMAVIMGAILEPLDALRAHLNGWMTDTDRRIIEQEKAILNRKN